MNGRRGWIDGWRGRGRELYEWIEIDLSVGLWLTTLDEVY